MYGGGRVNISGENICDLLLSLKKLWKGWLWFDSYILSILQELDEWSILTL